MLHKEKKITIGYNVLLFVIFLVFHAMNAVLEYKEEQFFVDKLFDYDFVFGVSLFVILFFCFSNNWRMGNKIILGTVYFKYVSNSCADG